MKVAQRFWSKRQISDLQSVTFYRAMLCIARTMLSQDLRPSVCPSVCNTLVFCRNV